MLSGLIARGSNWLIDRVLDVVCWMLELPRWLWPVLFMAMLMYHAHTDPYCCAPGPVMDDYEPYR